MQQQPLKASPAELTAHELGLLTGAVAERMSISFKPMEAEPAVILFPEYPLELAKIFSGFAAANVKVKETPSLTALRQLVQPGKPTLAIVGGVSEPARILKDDMTRVQLVFRWTHGYAKGGKELPVLKGHQLYEHLRLLDVAEELEVPLLVDAFKTKIGQLYSGRFSLDNIEAVVGFYCRGEHKWEAALEACAQAVANGIISKPDPKMTATMEANEAFGQALGDDVFQIELAREEAEQLKQQRQQQKRQRQEQRKARRDRGHFRR